eukprot:5915749-Pyramimonas_sp.AAC.1
MLKKKHQLIPSKYPRDHVPLHCNLRWDFQHPPEDTVARVFWNVEAMKFSEDRQSFLEGASQKVQELSEDLGG